MLWFEGSIPDAISSAKQRSYIFVVVITGEDEQSAQLMSSWEDDRVSEATRSNCVAIKVDAKRYMCLEFNPVVCIPSSFFIGDNGIPLEVIAGSVPAEELRKRINKVKQVWPSRIGEDLKDYLTFCFPHYNHSSVKCELSISNNSVKTFFCSKHHSQLTKKLEDRQKQKKNEEENEFKKEIKRRKVGKDLQESKRKQEVEKTEKLLKERNREKVEQKAARERVKQQIALDRAERAAHYAKTQKEENAAKQALLHARQAEQEARKEALVRERSTLTRIQFRLPDGSSFTNQFPSQSRLQEAHHFVVQEVGNRYGNFSLATMFPRREFNSDDLNKTLLELELAPSASIVLLPLSGDGNAVAHSSGDIWAVLGTLLYPLLALWRFLSSFLFANPPTLQAASRGPAHQSTSYTNSASEKKSLEKQPKDFKKDGKICRLQTQDDSEEDNNTWNGNSTQQM
uniref:UBX domain-containing protein 4 n=1 Tax=Mola mola TaxID=94237 RepID=A0A3Q4AUF0_MOLML